MAEPTTQGQRKLCRAAPKFLLVAAVLAVVAVVAGVHLNFRDSYSARREVGEPAPPPSIMAAKPADPRTSAINDSTLRATPTAPSVPDLDEALANWPYDVKPQLSMDPRTGAQILSLIVPTDHPQGDEIRSAFEALIGARRGQAGP